MTTALERATAPANAFSFGAENIIFAESTDEKTTPITLLARRGDPIEHWYWGRIVHDFDGMLHRDKLAIDYEHDTSEPIGYVDAFEVRDGDLYLSGRLASIAPGDEADKMMRRSSLGVPYQASIFFDDEQDLILESVGEGFTAQANGRDIEGPAVIVRQWHLRGVAVTPHGYDIGTESMFSKSPSGGDIRLKWKGATMPKTKPESLFTAAKDEQVDEAVETTETPAVAEAVADAPAADEPEAVVESKEVEPDSPAIPEDEKKEFLKARQMLGLFSDHFGKTDAAEYFAAGKNLTEAALSHVEKLSARVTELEAERDAAIQKLSAAQLGLGEKDSVDTGTTKEKQTKSFADMFKKSGSN